MPKATYEILYREIIGAGNDNEANTPHGIVVTLSRWSTANNAAWKVPDQFYLLQRTVMIDRDTVLDEIEMIRNAWNKDSQLIRKAIFLVDQLKELNPEVEAAMKAMTT